MQPGYSSSSARRYSPQSAWWNTTIALGSAARQSDVDLAVTPKPSGTSAAGLRGGRAWEERWQATGAAADHSSRQQQPAGAAAASSAASPVSPKQRPCSSPWQHAPQQSAPPSLIPHVLYATTTGSLNTPPWQPTHTQPHCTATLHSRAATLPCRCLLTRHAVDHHPRVAGGGLCDAPQPALQHVVSIQELELGRGLHPHLRCGGQQGQRRGRWGEKWVARAEMEGHRGMAGGAVCVASHGSRMQAGRMHAAASPQSKCWLL